MYKRRASMEKRGAFLPTLTDNPQTLHVAIDAFVKRHEIQVRNGCVIVFSDAHYWPGDPSLAHMALIDVIKSEKPQCIIANGDLLDAESISRHEPRGWKGAPTLREELDVVVERLGEVEKAAPNGCMLRRTLGNHDIRYERWLAVHAPQYDGIRGMSLVDHIPKWGCSWSVEVNAVIVKHRWANGIHATYNNTLRSGRSIVTGHLHSLQVRPWTDYNGTRYGVDTGTLSDPEHDAFDYTEDNPKNWRSGFAILRFANSKLLWPDLCYIDGGRAYVQSTRTT